jgi:hypothetical protein
MRPLAYAGVAMALTVTAVSAATVGAAHGASSRTSIALYEHDTQQATIDLGSTGPGPGDVFVFAGDLFDRKGGKLVGHAAGNCTTTSGDTANPEEMLCTLTFSLSRGQIASQGLFASAALFGGKTLPFAVTGGTGAYRDTRGDATVQVLTDVPNQTDTRIVLAVG